MIQGFWVCLQSKYRYKNNEVQSRQQEMDLVYVDSTDMLQQKMKEWMAFFRKNQDAILKLSETLDICFSFYILGHENDERNDDSKIFTVNNCPHFFLDSLLNKD